MGTKTVWVALGLALAGCATGSAGGAGGSDAVVPVYATADEVPCAFEVVRTVRGSTSRTDASAEERTLGRAGARAGVDAVLLPERESPEMAVRREVGRSGNPPATRIYEGQGIRFLDPGCKPPR